jgi:hypothetical protein
MAWLVGAPRHPAQQLLVPRPPGLQLQVELLHLHDLDSHLHFAAQGRGARDWNKSRVQQVAVGIKAVCVAKSIHQSAHPLEQYCRPHLAEVPSPASLPSSWPAGAAVRAMRRVGVRFAVGGLPPLAGGTEESAGTPSAAATAVAAPLPFDRFTGTTSASFSSFSSLSCAVSLIEADRAERRVAVLGAGVALPGAPLPGSGSAFSSLTLLRDPELRVPVVYGSATRSSTPSSDASRRASARVRRVVAGVAIVG